MTWSQSVTPAVPSMSAEMKTFMNTSCGTAVSDPGRIRARASGYLLQPEHGAHLADGPSVMVADDGMVAVIWVSMPSSKSVASVEARLSASAPVMTQAASMPACLPEQLLWTGSWAR